MQAITVNVKQASEVALPAGGRVEGAAYWQVQDDAARIWELADPALSQDQAGGDGAGVVVTYGGATTRPTDIEGALYGW